MAWIRMIAEAQATGLLRKIYDDAIRRAGRVFNILRIQSVNPPALRASMALYAETTIAESPVPRDLREMIAVVVSRTNGCRY